MVSVAFLCFGFVGLRRRRRIPRLLVTLFAMAVAALPGLLMTVFRNVGKRRAVGVIWDVTTFWPRAVHPLAPPCYAERVIPQLICRVQALQERGPVLVSGHSQGAMIASALFQQLPSPAKDKALVTYGCQLSFLFARAFPAYCGGFVLDQLAADLAVPSAAGPAESSRWLNLFRLTDLLGSTVAATLAVSLAAGAGWETALRTSDLADASLALSF